MGDLWETNALCQISATLIEIRDILAELVKRLPEPEASKDKEGASDEE